MLRDARRTVAKHAERFAFGAVVLFVFCFHAAYHEPWRDEAQAWLISRAESLGTLMQALRYESHPPLVYLILDPLAHVGAPLPLAFLAALNTAFLLGGTHALLRAMGATRRTAIAFTIVCACTYIYVYELGVVARAYGLGLGLAFWMMAAMHRALAKGEHRDLRIAGLAGAASALTSATAAVYVAVAVVVFGVMWIFAQPNRRIVRVAWLAPIAPAMWLVHEVTKPLPDRWIQFEHLELPQRTWDVDWRESRKWLQEIFGSGSSNSWWPTKDIPASHFDWAVEGLRMLVVAVVVVNGIRFVREWRTAFFVPVASALQVAAIFYVIFYRGLRPDYRHWAFVMGSAQVVLGGLCLVATRNALLLKALRRATLVLLAPWLWNQTVTAYSNLSQDAAHPFSLTKEFARALPHGARVIVDRDVFGTSISYWRPDVVTRSPEHRGRYFTYVRWDRAEYRASARLLAHDECGKSATRTVYVFGNLADVPSHCASPMTPPYTGVKARTDEYSSEWAVSCDCLLRP